MNTRSHRDSGEGRWDEDAVAVVRSSRLAHPSKSLRQFTLGMSDTPRWDEAEVIRHSVDEFDLTSAMTQGIAGVSQTGRKIPVAT